MGQQVHSKIIVFAQNHILEILLWPLQLPINNF